MTKRVSLAERRMALQRQEPSRSDLPDQFSEMPGKPVEISEAIFLEKIRAARQDASSVLSQVDAVMRDQEARLAAIQDLEDQFVWVKQNSSTHGARILYEPKTGMLVLSVYIKDQFGFPSITKNGNKR